MFADRAPLGLLMPGVGGRASGSAVASCPAESGITGIVCWLTGRSTASCKFGNLGAFWGGLAQIMSWKDYHRINREKSRVGITFIHKKILDNTWKYHMIIKGNKTTICVFYKDNFSDISHWSAMLSLDFSKSWERSLWTRTSLLHLAVPVGRDCCASGCLQTLSRHWTRRRGQSRPFPWSAGYWTAPWFDLQAQGAPFNLDELFKNLESDVFGGVEDQIMGQFSNQHSMAGGNFDFSKIFNDGLKFGGNIMRNSQGQQAEQDQKVLSWFKGFFPNS